MEKVKVGKYKNKTFEEAKKLILEKDKDYINYLKRLVNKDEKNKKNIQSFINYIEDKNILEFENIQIQNIKQNEIPEIIPEIIHLSNTDKKYTHIIHLSDIHIRLYKRYKEYQDIFNKLYFHLKSYENILIVITGDLLHSKNQLSPECIIFTQDFLSSLCSIAPVILIAGNHDALLTNNQRLDSITAIIDKANIPNLYYLKYSNIYIFNNIAFSICSLLDNKWIFHKNIPTINVDKIIALYHGGVGTVDTGVGYRLRGEKLISDFEGYDYVLLGDIHKHQFLAPNIAYSGSLIIQNFNEWSFKHGFILWDLYNQNHKFIEIVNKCGFFIFILKNNNIFVEEDLISIQDIPKYLQNITDTLEIKLQIENCSQEFIFEIEKKIKLCGDNVNIYHSFIKELNNTNTDINVQNENILVLLEKLLLTIFKITNEEDIKYIIQEFEKLNSSEINIADKPLNRWVLLDLDFSNMFGYGENNYIDFSRFENNTIVGLFANNGYGKSSLIDIILFTLFSKFSRYSGNGISKDIININKNSFKVKLRLKIGSTIYQIYKEGKREKSGKIKINQDVSKIEDETIISLNDESRIKTDTLIQNEIGKIEEFIFTNIQLQNREKSFKDMANSERKEYLYKVFKLNIFDEKLHILQPKIKKLNEEILKLNKTSSLEIKNNIESEIEDINNILNKETQSLIEQKSKLKSNENLIEDLTKLTNKIQHLTPNKILENKDLLNKLIKEKDILEEKLKINQEIIINKKDNKINISNLETKQKELQNNISNLQKDIQSLIPTNHLTKKITNLSIKELINNKKNIIKEKENTNQDFKDINTLRDELESFTIYNIDNNILKELKCKIKEREIVIEKINLLKDELKIKSTYENILNKYHEETNLRKEFNYTQEKIKINNELIDKLNHHEFDPKCKFCIKNPIVKQALEAKKENEILKNKEFKIMINENEKVNAENQMKILIEQEKKLIQKKTKLEALNPLIEELKNKEEKYYINKENEKKITELKNTIKEEQKKKDNFDKKILKFDKDIKELDEQIEIRIELDEIEDKNRIITSKNSEIEKIITMNKDELNKINEDIKLYHKDKLELVKLMSSFNEDRNRYEIIKENIINLSDELSLLDENSIVNLEKLDNLKKTNKELNNKLNELFSNKGKYEEKLNNYQIQLDNVINELKIKKIKEKELELLKILEKALGKNGLPLYLLNEFIPLITNNVNKIISPFLNREILIKLEDENILFESFNKYNKEKSVQIHGGMESFMMDLAFKITIGKFAKLPKCDILFIDEGISALDKDKINNIDTLFEFLKNHFNKIILITHIDTVKDSIIEKIEIYKQNNLSYINCIYSN